MTVLGVLLLKLCIIISVSLIVAVRLNRTLQVHGIPMATVDINRTDLCPMLFYDPGSHIKHVQLITII